jgi:hypothetical protein
MKKRKQFALNKLFNFCVVLGLLFAWGSIDFFTENDTAWGLGFGIVGFLLIVLPSIFTPYCYAFDSVGVSLCYVFLPIARYLWKNIRAIENTSIGVSRDFIFEFFCASVFAIQGTNVGKCRFYMKGHIRKSFRTKYLLEKYWDGTITGYAFEDAKKWINKRRAKKQKQIESHFTDAVVLMEREIRAEAREWLKPFIDQAKQYDLELKAKYFYITKDFEERNSRPKEGYTYTLIAEIAHFNETDENKIVIVSVDLLYARLGKTSYRGVKNEHAQEELQMTISDVLNEINKIGIEAYNKEN